MESKVEMSQIKHTAAKQSTEETGLEIREERNQAEKADMTPDNTLELSEADSALGHPVRQAYTVEEVATIIGCHPKTVRKLCVQGKIQSFSLGPRVRRIPRSSLEDFMGFKIK